MVYLVGGYKLTEAQARHWCNLHDLYPPESNICVYVNRWLRERNIIRTRLLACTYHGRTIFLLVMKHRVDHTGTPIEFKRFEEDERDLVFKREMGIEDVEFVTVPNPYGS